MSKNHLWKFETPRFQKWLKLARGACVNHYKLEDIEKIELEIKKLIKFKEVSNVKVNH